MYTKTIPFGSSARVGRKIQAPGPTVQHRIAFKHHMLAYIGPANMADTGLMWTSVSQRAAAAEGDVKAVEVSTKIEKSR